MLESILPKGTFIANDINFQNSPFKCLTGINMGGKTIFMKMVGICVLLAQIGHPIPADAATISLVDNIFIRA